MLRHHVIESITRMTTVRGYCSGLLVCCLMLSSAQLAAGQAFDETDNTCGVTKSCSRDFSVFLSWRYNTSTNTVFFEMSGKSDGYIAMGLSVDNKMGDDSVTECVKSTDETVSVLQSWNTGYSNKRLTPSDVGLSDQSGSFSNGHIYCSFSRANQVAQQSDFYISTTIDNEYYILLVSGSVKSGDNPPKKNQHSKSSASTDPIKLGDTGLLGAADKNEDLMKAHACLLLTAWMLCASVSVILARYYKAAWPDKTIFSLKVWFQIHRALMIPVLALHVIGIIVVFVYVEGYTEDNGETLMIVHPILGLIVTGLVIANPLMSLFRCAPDSAKRPLFNWAHMIVGMSAHILAVVTIFLGMVSAKSEKVIMPDWVVYVMVGFVVLHVVTDILLEINKCAVDRSKDDMNSAGMEMTQDGKAAQRKPQSHTRSYIILCVYLLLAIAIWLIMVITIAIYSP